MFSMHAGDDGGPCDPIKHHILYNTYTDIFITALIRFSYLNKPSSFFLLYYVFCLYVFFRFLSTLSFVQMCKLNY